MIIWQAKTYTDIRPTTLDWLWPRYFAQGKLILLDGDPGLGKSLIALDLIARFSRSGMMPDGSPGTSPRTSLFLSTEDDVSDTIRPRAEAAGADLNRLIHLDFTGRSPRFPEDLPSLEALIREHEVALMVVDPLMAFLPRSIASHFDQCVRHALTPLTELATRTRCTILFVRHLVKTSSQKAIHRGQGSMGILASMRAGFLAAPHPRDNSLRVLAATKHNVGHHPPSLGYRIVPSPSGSPVIEWTGPLEMTADDLCRRHDPGVKMKDRAIAWLRKELTNGPRLATELYTLAADAGIPERTLDRAKAALHIDSHRHHDRAAGRTEWYWSDPDATWPKDAPFKKPKPWELEPIRGLEDL